MQIVALRTLRQFWEKHPQAETPIRIWYAAVSKVEWRSPVDVKRQFGTTADFVADNRLIFDLSGNRYRLIVHVSYTYKRVLVKFVGTHAEYDRIDALTWSRDATWVAVDLERALALTWWPQLPSGKRRFAIDPPLPAEAV